MATMQKMVSEIRDLIENEWDLVGGMGAYGPSQEASQMPTTCTVYIADRNQTVTTIDDAYPDTSYD